MSKSIRVLVIGVGRFGTAVVQTLWDAGADVIVVDSSPDSVDAVKARSGHAYVGDATNPAVLEGVGASTADAAVITFGMDFEATVLSVAALVKLGVRSIVARAETPRQADILRTIGATRVVQIEAEMGERLAADLLGRVSAELIELAAHFRIVPWVVRGPLAGQRLADARLRERWDVSVIGVRARSDRGGSGAKARIAVPRADTVLGDGDTLVVVGEEKHVSRFLAEAQGNT